jgi:hypothetical protein
MYGSWFGVILAVVGVLLLLVASAATGWTPLFAFVIFGVIAAGLLVIAAMRRSAEGVPGRETHRGDPEAHAAPVAGEGSSGTDGGAPESGEAGQAPERESAGIWGERG